ncbi:hypothetical protein [Albirhodobacter sp. R86504]|jgi:hypothetical protein|uniref:hypothetical protein n=1 Tax=Albirhodobacter sp. R86504 TaxID=3093848 RepID=UPI00367180C7
MRITLLFTALFLAACAQDETDWPNLLPIEDVLAEAPAPTTDPSPALESRAAALEARAAALRGNVITQGSLPGY